MNAKKTKALRRAAEILSIGFPACAYVVGDDIKYRYAAALFGVKTGTIRVDPNSTRGAYREMERMER